MSQAPKSMIERISANEGVFDFNNAPNDIKLHVYTLAIKEILTILQMGSPRTLSGRTLIEFEDSLSEIIDGFMELSAGPEGSNVMLKKIQHNINEAYSHLSTALLIYKEKEKSIEYFKHLQSARGKLFEALSQLET